MKSCDHVLKRYELDGGSLDAVNLYFITFVVKDDHLKSNGIWNELQKCSSEITNIFKESLNFANNKIVNNHSRSGKRFKRLHVICGATEHCSREDRFRCSTHIHAVVGVSKENDNKFRSLLSPASILESEVLEKSSHEYKRYLSSHDQELSFDRSFIRSIDLNLLAAMKCVQILPMDNRRRSLEKAVTYILKETHEDRFKVEDPDSKIFLEGRPDLDRRYVRFDKTKGAHAKKTNEEETKIQKFRREKKQSEESCEYRRANHSEPFATYGNNRNKV